MLGKVIIASVLGITAIGQSRARVQPPQIAGSWNVTSMGSADYTCKNVKPGDTQAYIWIVSTKADGSVTVSVQGETSFPRLDGRWSFDSRTLILEGSATGILGGRATSWFKLSFEGDNTLHGVRRYIAESQPKSAGPCFADFEISAKRQ
jgi:hypothetical protein